MMSSRLQELVAQVPGAEHAYMTDLYVKSIIDQLDIHRNAVLGAMTGEAAPTHAEAIADRYATIMLVSLVDDAARNARVLAGEQARLMKASVRIQVTDGKGVVLREDLVEPDEGLPT